MEEKDIRHLNLVDGLTILFISLILLLIILLYPRFLHGRQLLAGFSLLLMLALFISEARRRWSDISIARVICDFSPIFFILIIFELLGYYLCFTAYIAMPAIGPRFTLASLQQVPLQGGAILNFVINTLNALEGNQRDCFPSEHTQTVLISLWFAFKYKRALFWVYLPITIALIFSTVYLRYHYVIDVIAGVAYAGITQLLGVGLWTWWERYQKEDLKIRRLSLPL